MENNGSEENTVKTTSEVWPKRTKWLVAGMIVAIVGIVLQFYSISHHIAVKTQGKTDFACNINDDFSCDDVVATKYSEFIGIPLGVWGLGFFLSVLILLGMALARGDRAKAELQTFAVMSAVGLLVSIIYGSISKFVIGAMCPSCMATYLTTAVQMVVAALLFKDMPKPYTIKNLINGGSVAVILVALVAAGYHVFKPSGRPNPDTVIRTDVPDIPVMNFLPTVNEIKINESAYSGLGEDYRKGGDKAKAVLVEFSDFQCPGCAQASKVIMNIAKKFGDDLLVVFKNYPLDRHCHPNIKREYHEYACHAAILARCAGQYGKFWDFHDKAFGNRQKINTEVAIEWAREIGLTDDQINSCLVSKDIMAKIKDDIAQGNVVGVEATPTLVLNGRKFIGHNYTALDKEIEKILTSDESQTTLSSPLDDIKKFVDDGKAVLVDVREVDDWDAGHVEGATHLPLSSMRGLKKGDKVATLPDDKILYTYCKSGQMCRVGARVLQALGYNAHPLPVPVADLYRAGFPQTQSFGPLKK